MTTKVKEAKFLDKYSNEMIHQSECIPDLSKIAQYYSHHEGTQPPLELMEAYAKTLTCHIRQREDLLVNALHPSSQRMDFMLATHLTVQRGVTVSIRMAPSSILVNLPLKKFTR